VQVPLLTSRQVFVNETPGAMSVSSGMVTSIGSPGEALSQGWGVAVGLAVGGAGVALGVPAPGVSVGVAGTVVSLGVSLGLPALTVSS